MSANGPYNQCSNTKEADSWENIEMIAPCSSYLIALTKDGRIRKSDFESQEYRKVIDIMAYEEYFAYLYEDGTCQVFMFDEDNVISDFRIDLPGV